MFRTHSNVEGGRVKAHETAESASLKVHELIDMVAEGAVVGSEKATELKENAGAKAELAKGSAAAKAAELRAQAEDARHDAQKRAKKQRKAAVKRGKKARKDASDLKHTLVDDVLPRVVETAGALAATGAVAGRKLADEASVRGPEAFHALKDDHDKDAAIAALKGETKKRKGRKRLLLLALVIGGIAAYLTKQKATPKKDPWAVPAGDPYKAPETGRESSITGAVPAAPPVADSAAVGDPVTGAPASDPMAAPSSLDEDPLAPPVAPLSDEADARATSEGEGDAWSSARDWADDSSVPSISGTSEGTDLSTDHIGNDQPVDGGVEETRDPDEGR